MAERREDVVVTGMGVVSGFGAGTQPFWEGILAGRSTVSTIRAFDASGFPVRIASEVDETTLPLELIQPPKRMKLMNRSALFGSVASCLARKDAGLEPDDVAAERLGVVFGAGGMGAVDLEFLEAEARTLSQCEEDGGFDWRRFCEVYQRTVNPLAPIRALPNGAGANVAILHEARGPNLTVATACSSGTQAIGQALRLLQHGEADVVLAGGTDAMVNPTGILGFHLLGTLSTRNDTPEAACRPFDSDRDGFVLGEGAAVLVLEREEFALARGARIYAGVAGYASNSDAYRMTDERPDGSGPRGVMSGSLRDADIAPSEVGYVNAHGTATRLNDPLETKAVKAVFGADSAPPLSSIKSMIGHLLAGAGAVECVATVLAISESWLPPTVNHETADPECDLDYVANTGRRARVGAALTNSFGFGGQNASLVVTRHARTGASS